MLYQHKNEIFDKNRIKVIKRTEKFIYSFRYIRDRNIEKGKEGLG